MADHYVKKFDTSDHLISMLFSTFAHCTSLREVAASMLGLKGKMNHFQLKHIPYKSTLSDANKRRSHLVFQDGYYSLLKEFHPIISGSRQSYAWENRLEIIDSSTISLFKDVELRWKKAQTLVNERVVLIKNHKNQSSIR